jgi:M6 family metalloprotease-like protein
MNKRLIAILSILSLLVLLPLIPANAAAKAGEACSKLNTTSITGSKKFTCIKSGKKLIWNKGVAVGSKSATPIAKIPDPVVTDNSTYLSISECKLARVGNNSDLYIGFPRDAKYPPAVGDRKTVVLFVDFADLSPNPKALSEMKNVQIPHAEKTFEMISYGKYRLKFDLVEKVYRLPSTSDSYLKAGFENHPLGKPMRAMDHQKVISETVKAADADIDFSKYDFLNIITPDWKEIVEPGASGAPNLNVDGKTFFLSNSGPPSEYIGDPIKINFTTHEVGHILGLTHIYDYYNQKYSATWDFMGATFAMTDLIGWNKFFLSWIDDSQVNCLSSDSTTQSVHLLTSVGSSTPGTKMVIIKLSPTTALGIENRRQTGLDKLKSSDEGVIVYKIDTTKVDGTGAIQALSKLNKITRDRAGNGAPLSTMTPGESISTDGFTIKVLKRSTNGDFVSISRS